MAFYNTDTSATGLFGAGMGVLSRNLPVLVLMGAATAVTQIIHQIEKTSQFGGQAGIGLTTFAVAVVSFVVQLTLMRAVLSREGLVAEGAPVRFFAYLGVSIVVGLAVGFGALLLLVPGILIFMRWYIASLFVLARGAGIGEALDASSRATSGHRAAMFGAVVLASAILWVPIAGLVVAAGGFWTYVALPWHTPIGLVGVALTTLVTPLINAVHIAIFGSLAAASDQFDNVFA